MSNYFSGAFAVHFEKFIEQKRAIGYRYEAECIQLGYFDTFSKSFDFTGELRLSKELVEVWTQKREYESDKTRLHRVSVIREFARFLIANGIEAYILPSQKKGASNFKPYIFTTDEIAGLFKATGNIQHKTVSPLIDKVMPVLLRILYGCGLRISEALALRRCDVDIASGTITVLNSKCDGNRLVVMSDSLRSTCKNYLSAMPVLKVTDPFFPNRYGQKIDKRTIYNQFRKLLWNAGISHGGRGNGPRLHDLRHTFAIRAMQQLVNSGKSIYIVSPILSAYLGHKSLRATERYLRLTAEMFPEIVEKFETAFRNAVPWRPL